MAAHPSSPPTASSIVRVLNEEVRHYHRWCTPSTLVDQERIEDFYASDISISAGFFGTLVDHTGVFGGGGAVRRGGAGRRSHDVSVHGSTGSNFVVLRMLALERPDALVLVARNCHHSVVNAIKGYGLDFRFLPTPYDPEFEAVLPPSAEEVIAALRRYPEALAVVYTSPTYEGLCADTRAIAAACTTPPTTRSLFVDEAWGGHLHFHPALPPSAMDAGADIAVQSTHKLAGGLQQTGLIHWREGRVDSELMEEAFREYVTTARATTCSPPPTPPCARWRQRTRRRSARASSARTRLKRELRDAPAAAPAPRRPRRASWRRRPRRGHRRVKTTVSLAATGCRASRSPPRWWSTASWWRRRASTRSRSSRRSSSRRPPSRPPYGAGGGARRGGAGRGGAERDARQPVPAIDDRPVMHPYHARRYAKAIGQEVALRTRSAASRRRRSRSTRRGSRDPRGLPRLRRRRPVPARRRDMGGAIVARGHLAGDLAGPRERAPLVRAGVRVHGSALRRAPAACA